MKVAAAVVIKAAAVEKEDKINVDAVAATINATIVMTGELTTMGALSLKSAKDLTATIINREAAIDDGLRIRNGGSSSWAVKQLKVLVGCGKVTPR